jgi:glycosyltransferase involved in cell wall biosynthesis
MNEKIGLGITTFNRFSQLMRLYNTIPYKNCGEFGIDELVIVNDGDRCVGHDLISGCGHRWIDSDHVGVGKAKNKALQHLLDQGCDHIFLIEDDIYIKDASVFQKYIEASKGTGIQHFNFSQHGIMNKTFDGLSTPNPRMIVKYGDIQVPLYPHCVGAFSYFSRKCLETVGLMDEEYYNACEHMDHTLEIIKAGMHPPFWYFADIENSWEYLGDEPWSLQQSTISSKPDHFEVMRSADRVFFKKHGHYPLQTPLTDEESVVKSLKEIKKNYGIY